MRNFILALVATAVSLGVTTASEDDCATVAVALAIARAKEQPRDACPGGCGLSGACGDGKCQVSGGAGGCRCVAPVSRAVPSSVPVTQVRVGGDHTHTCSRGHTWDHSQDGGSHNCPVCGEHVTVVSGFGSAPRSAAPVTYSLPQATYARSYSLGSFGGGCSGGACATGSCGSASQSRGVFGRWK